MIGFILYEMLDITWNISKLVYRVSYGTYTWYTSNTAESGTSDQSTQTNALRLTDE